MKTVIRIASCLVLALLLWTGVFRTAASAEGADPVSRRIDCTDDQLSYGKTVALLNRIRVQASSTGARKAATTALFPVLCQTDGTAVRFDEWGPLYLVAGPSDCYTLYFDNEALAEKAAAELSALAGIRYAERDFEAEACGTGSVSFQSWGAESMAFGRYLDYSRAVAGGSAAVAVVDSGVFPHSLYADRMLDSGYDYVDGDDDATSDPFGHGTNVTGVLADCTQGFPVRFLPIRVLNASGSGSVSNVVNGIREAIGRGVDIINLSLAIKKVSAALDTAVRDALDAGITVVVAAGNAAMDTAGVSPANIAEAGVIVVGAAEADGSLASYSNYGASVDLYAYGTEIVCCSNSGGYTSATGTSVSAPHVAGLAALILLNHPDITPAEIETRVCRSTDLTAEVNIPDLVRIVPAHPGFSLTLLKMDMHDSVQLPTAARPESAMESVVLSSGDTSVVSVQDGLLTPVAPGRAEITACCPGLPDVRFTVEVTDGDCATITLPSGLGEIGDEAFFGADAARHIVLPESCRRVGERAFASCGGLMTVEASDNAAQLAAALPPDAVVLCAGSGETEELLLQNHVPYIMKP